MIDYADRLAVLIAQIRDDLAQLPEGPERKKMDELLEKMERIVEERLK